MEGQDRGYVRIGGGGVGEGEELGEAEGGGLVLEGSFEGAGGWRGKAFWRMERWRGKDGGGCLGVNVLGGGGARSLFRIRLFSVEQVSVTITVSHPLRQTETLRHVQIIKTGRCCTPGDVLRRLFLLTLREVHKSTTTEPLSQSSPSLPRRRAHLTARSARQQIFNEELVLQILVGGEEFFVKEAQDTFRPYPLILPARFRLLLPVPVNVVFFVVEDKGAGGMV